MLTKRKKYYIMFLEKKQEKKETKMNPEIIGKRVKILMTRKGIKRSYLAKMMGISYNTLTNKLNGKSEFSVIQIAKIKQLLELNDELSANIFFNPNFEMLDNKEIS